jgi:hypothetical protein
LKGRNGDDRDRTDNPRLAKAVLSQLSYVPGGEGKDGRIWIRTTPENPHTFADFEVDGTESGTPEPFDTDLTAVVNAWPTLPGTIRAAILAIVRAGK